VLTTAPPTRVPLSPARSISSPALTRWPVAGSTGFLYMQPALLAASGCTLDLYALIALERSRSSTGSAGVSARTAQVTIPGGSSECRYPKRISSYE
jgi:hypothetical protein